MGIRGKILIWFGLLFVLLASANLYFLRQSVLPSFVELEQKSALDNVSRVVQSLDNELDHLDNLLNEWAAWDDVYNYVVTHDVNFARGNLNDDTLVTARVSLMGLYDSQGNTLFERALQLETREPQNISSLFARSGPYFKPLITDNPMANGCGVLKAAPGIFLACWRPVLRSDRTGPPHGKVLMGRLIDAPLVRRLESQTQIKFNLQFEHPASMQHGKKPDQWHGVATSNRLGNAIVDVQDRKREFMLDWHMYDARRQPAGHLVLIVPRRITLQGEEALHLALGQITASAAIAVLILLVLIHFTLIRRLSSLARTVATISRNHHWERRTGVRGRDEIGHLADSVNGLLAVIEKHVAELRDLSLVDSLTGIPNRRSFDLRLDLEIQHHHRSSTTMALILIDIDHFKPYNDHYGHALGDTTLRQVAQALARSIRRSTDLIARYGGEEFVAILPHTDFAGTQLVIDKMRHAVASLSIPHAWSDTSAQVTISIGAVVGVPEDHTTSTEMIEAADNQLYCAKHGGRNKGAIGTFPTVQTARQ